MIFLKHLAVLLLLTLAGISYAQETTQDITVEWQGSMSFQFPDERIIRIPYAAGSVVNENGIPFLQKDIPGRISGIIQEENVITIAADSAERIQLSKLKSTAEHSISVVQLYARGTALSRINIPLLRQAADGSWVKVQSLRIRYAVSYANENTALPSAVTTTGSRSNARTSSVTGSVLATGDWYKLGVSQNGMYKIDYGYLVSLGIDPASVDPQTIQIYGNGGGMLPQANSVARYDDLTENAIYVSDGGDGHFDGADYILFYGQSPHTWKYNPGLALYEHSYNLYTEQNFYFLTVNQQNGLRISDQASTGSGGLTISTFNEHLFYETDQYNVIDSGREWYGDLFNQFTLSRTYSFDFSGAADDSTARLSAAVLGRSLVTTYFNYSLNGNTLQTQTVSAMLPGEYDLKGVPALNVYPFSVNSVSGNSLNVGVNFNRGSSSASIAHLNYLELNFERTLTLYNNQTMFRSMKSTDQATTDYLIANPTGGEVIWDITNPLVPLNQQYTIPDGNIHFNANSSTLKEYIIFKGNAFSAPAYSGKVTNQNLHAVQAPFIPDMVIVSHPSFMQEAQRLANFRNSNDGLEVLVVSTEQIYNEFSSGKQDITGIRDYIKMLYDRGTASNALQYLLLFGDGSFDYKNIIQNNSNYVPTYESRESLHPIYSYSSDDYYGFLDNTEGNWGESPIESDLMDIGIGRLPVKSAAEASIMVSKVIEYSKSSAETLGSWRTKITFMADDGNDNLHLQDAEDISNKVAATNKLLNINKIYLDAYPQESTPGGETAKLVEEAVNREIESGTLIYNYNGHGGVYGLTQEAVITSSTISNWTNYTKLPFMITATCDFGRFDDPTKFSAAELALLSGQGGVCGILTSTRTVYQYSNKILNVNLYDYIYDKDANGNYLRVGEIMMLTKNASLNVSQNGGASILYNNRNYSLLADPSMRINYPKETISLTTVNNVAVSGNNDTLKALSKATLEGSVMDYLSGTLLSDFNGQTSITVYDKPSVIPTLGSNGSTPTTFKLQNNFIFDGQATVTNGLFKISFIVPKDISYQYDYGKISLYGEKNTVIDDAGGYYTKIVIGGSNPTAPADNTPPKISLFMNDASFVSGGATGSSPVFYANVSDENGINISSAGVGHEITLTMNGSSEVVVLNKYYSAGLDDYTKGQVKYPLNNLTPGTYSLHFKVWDTYNNSSEEVLEFTVVNTDKIQLQHVLNYPNPFTTNTTFHFDHNRYGDDLLAQIQIYTVSGKLVKTLDETFYNSPSHISGLFWDGLDDYGDKIGRGVYVYKLKIRSLRDGSTTHVYEKLVLLN